MQAYKAEPVYVDVPNGGVLDKVYVKAGKGVKKGQPLAQLRNLDLELAIAKLVGQQKQYECSWRTSAARGCTTPAPRRGFPRSKRP